MNWTTHVGMLLAIAAVLFWIGSMLGIAPKAIDSYQMILLVGLFNLEASRLEGSDDA